MGSLASLFSSTSFASEEAEAHDTIQQTFGEMFEFIPIRTTARGQPLDDDYRMSYGIMGIFDWESDEVRLQQESAGVSSMNAELTFRRCDLQQPIRRGDQFKRCSTGQVFKARDHQRDSMSGVMVPVEQLGKWNGE